MTKEEAKKAAKKAIRETAKSEVQWAIKCKVREKIKGYIDSHNLRERFADKVHDIREHLVDFMSEHGITSGATFLAGAGYENFYQLHPEEVPEIFRDMMFGVPSNIPNDIANEAATEVLGEMAIESALEDVGDDNFIENVIVELGGELIDSFEPINPDPEPEEEESILRAFLGGIFGGFF
jgi:hypothetical protein